MRVAIIHYWLVSMRGGEKVLEALCECFPEADIFTHVFIPSKISATIRRHRVYQTFIASLPMARTMYQNYLPLMPLALEQLDLSGYDLVISSESGPAKGVIIDPNALHVCYCHTPMRYLWNSYHSYKAASRPLTRLIMAPVLHRMRLWDYASAARVDHFIANSANVANRIQKYYRRDSEIIYPPVDAHRPELSAAPTEDFYLHVGQLVKYKRTDVAVRAFSQMNKRLIVIGDGSEARALKKIAGPTIEMIGWQDQTSLSNYYARCRALVFVADEDFGIVPVEAMAAGKPVIALRRGGALETVIPGVTGLFFDEQDPGSLVTAVQRFEAIEHTFDRHRITKQANMFSPELFKDRLMKSIDGFLTTKSMKAEGRSKQLLRQAS